VNINSIQLEKHENDRPKGTDNNQNNYSLPESAERLQVTPPTLQFSGSLSSPSVLSSIPTMTPMFLSYPMVSLL
jgi:hypothetical protein